MVVVNINSPRPTDLQCRLLWGRLLQLGDLRPPSAPSWSYAPTALLVLLWRADLTNCQGVSVGCTVCFFRQRAIFNPQQFNQLFAFSMYQSTKVSESERWQVSLW